MSCRLIRNKNNEVMGSAAPNGEKSILFDALVNATDNINQAENLYNELASEEFKKWFGIDWETDPKASESLFTDENGEPKLIPEVGFYTVKNNNGESLEIAAEVKEQKLALDIGRELQGELVNTIVGFINEVRTANPDIFRNPEQVNKHFNLDPKTGYKGILAEKILLEAFTGLEQTNPKDVKKAKELYNILITQGRDVFVEALPEGVGMNNIPGSSNNASQLFILAYHNWNSIEDSAGNILKIGVRELLKDSLSNYGMKLREDVGEMEEFEEDFIRIYSQSRLTENPQQKLSAEAKLILSNITTGVNSLGYPQTMPIDRAYGMMAESVVGEPDWAEMKSKLDYYAQYKPEIRYLLNAVNKLDASNEAVLFSNFAQAYKNFILFKNIKATDNQGKTFFTNQIINSNQSHVAKKSKEKFRQNSRERSIPNLRAIYQIDKDGKRTVKPEKLKRLKSAWSNIEPVGKLRSADELTNFHVDSLGEYLWELGVQFGPTLETTQNNLRKYFIIGNESGDTGMILFKNFVFGKKPLQSFLNVIDQDNPKDIYRMYGSTIDKISELSVLFDTRPFGSFITGTNKSLYPINLSTSLDELAALISNPKNGEELNTFFETLLSDPFNMPAGSSKYASPLLMSLHASPDAQAKFAISILDSYKASNELIATTDYDNQSTKISFIERLIAFENRGSKDYTLGAIPIQADRPNLSFPEIPRVSKMMSLTGATRLSILEGFILQDLARINQATDQVLAAQEAEDSSSLYEGYHYLSPKDQIKAHGKIMGPFQKDGSAFTMPQIMGLEDTEVRDNFKMSYYVNQYITGELNGIELEKFKNALSKQVNDIETRLKGFETLAINTISEYGIDLEKEVNSRLNTSEKEADFLKDYIFEAFVQKIELTKLLRGGFNSAKNTTDYYKRMGLINSPGYKLFLQGMSKQDTEYGMPINYRAVTIRDFDFIDKDTANLVANEMLFNLTASGISEDLAISISDNYRSLNKTDAQGIISLTMYKNIMEGMGQWKIEDTEAYNNHQSRDLMRPHMGEFKDNKGNPRPLYPIKPYHEELTLRNNTTLMSMDKNSYTVLTNELIKNFPVLDDLSNQMDKHNIDVINTESANKGIKKEPQDFQNNKEINPNSVLIMNSSKLRFPQITPRKKVEEITFNVQLRKNIIANVQADGEYILGDNIISGSNLSQIYGEAISRKIFLDTKQLEKELGIPNLEKFATGTVEYGKAQKAYLQNIRKRVAKQVKDKDLPDNYLDALNIVPNGPFDWKFKIPLAFPNYQAKFEGIILSMYHNELFVQKLKGTEAVQIAELGGHEESGELKMYDGTNLAQVRIKASSLGLPIDTRIEDVDPERLIMIGYRIPQQGKNSALVMEVVDFLPESYEKTIMVPGGITKQMGSDFDIDKLFLVFSELNKEGEVIKPDYIKGIPKMNSKELNNVIFDVFRSILTDVKHLDEVLKPLDIQSIRSARDILGFLDVHKIDYNDPLAELQMEDRSKAGIAGRGLHSNSLAGRNVAQTTQNMSIRPGYAPIIDEEPYHKIGRTKDLNGVYTDSNISEYLSAAVDAANEPIQIDINDNIYTIPVTGMMLSVGIPIDIVIYFLSQPTIDAAIKHAKLNNISLGEFKKAVNHVITKIAGKGNYVLTGEVTSMSKNELLDNLRKPEDISIENGLKHLENFYQFYLVGRALQNVYKIITPDTMQNVTELAAINEQFDREDLYLRNENRLIIGAEELISHNQGTSLPLNPIGIAYNGIIKTMVKETNRLGFINNTPAFKSFKTKLKDTLDQFTFNTAQHKTIDRSLFLKIMSMPNSPLVELRGEKAGLISKEAIKQLYRDPNNNIVTLIENFKLRFPLLNNNIFVQSLEADPSNEEVGLFLVRLDIPFGASTADKNDLSNSLLDIIEKPQNYANTGADVETIRNFGKILVANQLLTHGFSPTFGSYIDLIPSKVLTTDILNPGKQTPVQFFEQEIQELLRETYFDDFIHEFVRSFGTLKPGNKPFLQIIKRIPTENAKGEVTFGKTDQRIWNESEQRYLNYFLTYTSRGPEVFVHTGASKYTRLNLKGKARKLNEVGIDTVDGKSLINREVDSTIDPPVARKSFKSPLKDNTDNNEDPLKICE